jgi:surfactin synthase thioesterase subunit/glycosyltransferase involved in cell wall biosynthesis
MRILLAQNSLYYPSHGGGDKSNRLLMEALAQRGHECRVVARLGSMAPGEHERFLEELASRGVAVVSDTSGIVIFRHRGVRVHVATRHPNLRRYFADQIAEFSPSVILTSTDDPAQLLLEAAVRADGPRVVFLARTTLAVPFGPDCAFASASKANVLRQVDGVVGVSQYVADYLRRWGGLDAVHLPISLMEPGPYACLGRFDNEFVTFVNPCAVKGISIFLGLAERMPDVAFAAVPGWGTRRDDLEALRRHANVRLLDPVDDVDRLFARTRVLLVPSLWAEARSRIIPEAMLRGVPVLAADVGGIPEAMLGVDYLLPVRPIRAYRHEVDEQMVPVAEAPEQDVGPWLEALRRLLEDKAHYEQLSRTARQKALAYAEGLSVAPFESYLEQVVRTPRTPAAAQETAPASSALESLSPEKRHLLALRLRKRALGPPAGNPWFPAADAVARAGLCLFAFPHAGAGASAFRGWGEGLPPDVAVCPARLPGRESRLAETPFRQMEALVAALGEAIQPYLDRRFAFFGHSMGAAIAFELARWLRRQGRPLPAALLVSSARAPQFRLGHVPPPEPSEQEFLQELDRLEGLPAEVRTNRDLLRVVLPALRADTALYRNYTYAEEPPLDCPIRAYGGSEDPHIRREHLEAWASQTTGDFALRMLPGGHFFIETARAEFLAALSSDLATLLDQ